jgi:hypothetical protein
MDDDLRSLQEKLYRVSSKLAQYEPSHEKAKQLRFELRQLLGLLERSRFPFKVQ